MQPRSHWPVQQSVRFLPSASPRSTLGFVGGVEAARLIWYELMGARAIVRELRPGHEWIGDLPPFPTHAWDTQHSEFTEVADGYAFAIGARSGASV